MSYSIRRNKRAIGSVNVVAREFIDGTWELKRFLSSVGTAHIVKNQSLVIISIVPTELKSNLSMF